MYKSQLQEYAQKAAIPPPVYEFVKEGASHEPRFKAIVILNNVTYESPPGFPNLKSAEHAAAKAALDGLLQTTGGTGVAPSPVHESGLCKNLLQEYAQKNSLPLPVYQSQRSGEDHAPTFTSSVEIAGVKYSGGSAKNKKEAEIKAARTALLAIQSAQIPIPVAVPEPPVAPAPVAHLGLATLISTHLNNTPGKKRGRGVAYPTVDEPSAGRLKTSPQAPQVAPEVHVKSNTPAAPPEMIETTMNLVTPSVSEVQQPPITSSVKSSVDIADLFSTPGARKILGKTSKLPQTENSYLLQGTSLFSSPMQGTALFSSPSASPSSKSATAGTTHFSSPSISPSPTVTANSNLGVQGKSNVTKNGVAEEVGSGNQTATEEVQVNLVSGASDVKEDQSLIQTTQSSGLISLTG